MKPLNDRVFVKPDDKETKTAGGIILSENQADKPVQGTVMNENDIIAIVGE